MNKEYFQFHFRIPKFRTSRKFIEKYPSIITSVSIKKQYWLCFASMISIRLSTTQQMPFVIFHHNGKRFHPLPSAPNIILSNKFRKFINCNNFWVSIRSTRSRLKSTLRSFRSGLRERQILSMIQIWHGFSY